MIFEDCSKRRFIKMFEISKSFRCIFYLDIVLFTFLVIQRGKLSLIA